jgi:DNA-binding transcriptional regulator YiaG
LPNIASVLKDEIVRLARKEMRSETEALKKASTHYRSEISALKKRLAALEQQLARQQKNSAKAEVPPSDTPTRTRYSAKGLRARRQKLGLSAADFGALLGVTAQTIYNWEAETTRPREQQMAAIAALRGIGKRALSARLEAVPTE